MGYFMNFYGSGIGKTCVQAYLDYPFKKVVGIEKRAHTNVLVQRKK